MKLNETECKLLLGIMNGVYVPDGKRCDAAIQSLRAKGILRTNSNNILELNLSRDYFTTRGYDGLPIDEFDNK